MTAKSIRDNISTRELSRFPALPHPSSLSRKAPRVKAKNAEVRSFIKQHAPTGKALAVAPVAIIATRAGLHAPDLDISLLGIGYHRYFLFHSAISLAVLRHLHKKWGESNSGNTAKESQASDKHGYTHPSRTNLDTAEPGPELSRTHRKTEASNTEISYLLHKTAGAALGFYSIGVGLHLLSDAIHPKSVVFPLTGSLVNGTYLDDTLWLLANSIWAFHIGYKLLDEMKISQDSDNSTTVANIHIW